MEFTALKKSISVKVDLVWDKTDFGLGDAYPDNEPPNREKYLSKKAARPYLDNHHIKVDYN